MNRKLRYGMVGGGPGAFIGDVHRRAIALGGGAELVAGCFSRSFEKTQTTGSLLGLDETRCYADYASMAAAEAAREDGIDFVVIVTPNNNHYEASVAFLTNGIHVSCDKPLCVSGEQADALVALSQEKGLLFMVTYTYMGYVMPRHVRALIDQGAIGKVRNIMAEYAQGWLANEEDNSAWRLDPAQSGKTNCLGDIGTHVENAVSRMTGLKIKRLLCKMDRLVPGRVLDDNDVILVEYEGGGTGLYWTSQVAIGSDNGLRVRIFGERGTLVWAQEDPEKIQWVKSDGELTEQHRGHIGITPDAARYSHLPSGHPEGVFEAMSNLYTGFTHCIQATYNGTFDPSMIDFPTVHDGAQGIWFIESCLKSAQDGNRWVEL